MGRDAPRQYIGHMREHDANAEEYLRNSGADLDVLLNGNKSMAQLNEQRGLVGGEAKQKVRVGFRARGSGGS